MRILQIDSTPIHRIRFLNAARGGGAESQVLPLLRGTVDFLPPGLEALLVTSDLQGVVQAWDLGGESRLLGVQLALDYEQLAADGKVPLPSATGVMLAGDFYSAPGGDQRGATGDVSDVWFSFAELGPRWLAGVPGNHDSFGSDSQRRRLESEQSVHLLDGDAVSLDGLRIGGVGYIIGNPAKAGRRDDVDFFAALDLVLGELPELLILHQGPYGSRNQRGDNYVADAVIRARVPLTVCGHVHWPEPLAQISPASQVLNVDSRAVLLTQG